MAGKKISQLTEAAALDGSELLPLVQGGQTVSASISDVRGVIQSALIAKTANQAIAAGATNIVTFENIVSDNGDFTQTPNGFICNFTGFVVVSASVVWDSAFNGTSRDIFIRKNGGSYTGMGMANNSYVAYARIHAETAMVPVVSGDVFNLYVYNGDTSTRSILNDPGTWMCIERRAVGAMPMAPETKTFRGALIRTTSDQALSSGVNTVVSGFSVASHDKGGFYNQATPDRLVIPAEFANKITRIDAQVGLYNGSNSGESMSIVRVYDQSGTLKASYNGMRLVTGSWINMPVTVPGHVFQAGDYVQLVAFKGTTGWYVRSGDTFLSLSVLED